MQAKWPIPIAEGTAPWHKDSLQWLQDAVFYEICLKLYDSSGDGSVIIPGITQKLGYIQSLGCNALWDQPCFDSPSRMPVGDVRNYKLVAPRRHHDDLIGLFSEAHRRGMHAAGPCPGIPARSTNGSRSSSADPGEFRRPVYMDRTAPSATAIHPIHRRRKASVMLRIL